MAFLYGFSYKIKLCKDELLRTRVSPLADISVALTAVHKLIAKT